MEFLGRKTIIGLVAFLMLFGYFEIETYAQEEYPLFYGKTAENKENYIVLNLDEVEYEVLPGDSLWRIAKQMWGDGNCYMELFEDNRDIVTNPDCWIYSG